jgi:plasmid stabilization system protein ParE
MAYTVTVKPGAEEDITNAYSWYEDQRKGLGAEFLAELVFYYKKLEQQPAVFGKMNKIYRQVVLRRFPYIIVFELGKSEVTIYAVFHKNRNPKNKLRRK